MDTPAKVFMQLFLASHSELLELAKQHDLPTHNKLGSYLPNVTLQELLYKHMSQYMDLNIKPTPAIKRNWYALFVHYGKEKEAIAQIQAQIQINAIPEYIRNVDSGLISTNFRLSDVMLDIAYPHQFDIHADRLVENYKSYLFVELGDIYDMNVFHNVIEPFFKNISCVVGLVGLNEKSKVRRKQTYSKNGREVVHYYNETIVHPRKVTEVEVRDLVLSSHSVDVKNQFNVGDRVWLSTKGHKCKVNVTKILDNNHYQVMGKDKFRFPVSGDLLSH